MPTAYSQPDPICERCGNRWVKTYSPATSSKDERKYCPECRERIHSSKDGKSRTDAKRANTGVALKEFVYQARDAKGKSVKGSLKANDLSAVAAELVKRSLIVISLEERKHLKKVEALAILVVFSVLILWAFLQLAKW